MLFKIQREEEGIFGLPEKSLFESNEIVMGDEDIIGLPEKVIFCLRHTE